MITSDEEVWNVGGVEVWNVGGVLVGTSCGPGVEVWVEVESTPRPDGGEGVGGREEVKWEGGR